MVGLTLKFRSCDRLHLSHGPGAISWTIFVALAVLGLVVANYGTECIIRKCACVTAIFILSLFSIGSWEDVVMDRNKKLVTFTRCNWYGRLCSRVSSADTRVLNLGSISRVEMRGDAVVLVLKNLTTVVIAAHTDRRQLQTVMENVSSFLRLSRMESVRREEVGQDWWLEWWDSLEAEAEIPPPSLQHSGVKVLVQPCESPNPTAA